ncbi:MAG: hypothetical protein HZC23_10255, partial [Rhodocyclales bacterium]|nr:hypothetical protein [Rhodocyclales bacterium]
TNAQTGDVLAWGALPGGITASLAGNVVTLSGSATLANYQTAIRAVTFSNTSDNPSTTPRSITVVVTDGSANSNTATTTVNITAVNDAPTLDLDASGAGTGYATFFNLDTGNAIPVGDIDVSVADPDNANITSATISISATNRQGTDVLVAGALPGGITASWNAATFTMTLSGSASLADYQAAIRAVSFDTGSANTGQRTITVAVNDGSLSSNTASTTVTILGSGNRPVIDLDANDSSGSTITEYQTTFTENGAAVSVADADVVITDSNSANMASATITLTNAQAGDVLAWGALPGGITASLAGNVVTLTGSASIANYQTAIRAVTFSNTGDNPSTAPRTITVTVNDGGPTPRRATCSPGARCRAASPPAWPATW